MRISPLVANHNISFKRKNVKEKMQEVFVPAAFAMSVIVPTGCSYVLKDYNDVSKKDADEFFAERHAKWYAEYNEDPLWIAEPYFKDKCLCSSCDSARIADKEKGNIKLQRKIRKNNI